MIDFIPWVCERCGRSGLGSYERTDQAQPDIVLVQQAIRQSHDVRSPVCDANFTNLRILIDIKKDLEQPLRQARSWLIVFNHCQALGMEPGINETGIKDVLDFISELQPVSHSNQ